MPATLSRIRSRRLAIAGIASDQCPLPRYLQILIEGFVEAGIEVDVLLPPSLLAEDVGIAPQVERFRLETGDDQAAMEDLRAYLAARHPSAILSNRDRTSTLLARLPREGRPRTLVRIGTNVIERLKAKPVWRRGWKRRRLAATLARADILVGVSDGVCDSLRELLRGREAPPIERIYNPVDIEHFRRLAAEPIAHPWLMEKSVPVLLSVGRLVRAKDYPTLIEAFETVRERLDSRLIILGEGNQRRRLERLIRSRGLTEAVDLPGFAPNPFVWMARADLFVLSSIFEGNPNVLVESMAVGTPCVATDCRSGPRETLDGGRFGRLVPPRQSQTLARAMLESLANPIDPEHLSEAVQRFGKARAISAYLHSLRLAEERHSGGGHLDSSE